MKERHAGSRPSDDWGHMNQPLWWMLTLAVSAIAIVAYWFIVRRQVRTLTTDLQRRLDQEHRLVAYVSHRLRNQLTVVYGFSETLADASHHNTDDVPGIAAIVSAEALEASRTVEDLVAAREIEDGDLQIRTVGFDPAEEIERAVTPFQRLGSDISIEAWSGTAVSDPLHFRKVLQNMLSNAVRHGGAEIAVHADLSGSSYECTIADDGDGLPADVVRRFFATSTMPERVSLEEADDDHPKGTDSADLPNDAALEKDRASPRDADRIDGLGLGLAVAVGLAESLGGSLRYERADGLTAFTLVLPTASWPEPLIPMHTESTAPETVEEDEPHEESIHVASDGSAETWQEDTIRFDQETPDRSENDDEVLVEEADNEVRAS